MIRQFPVALLVIGFASAYQNYDKHSTDEYEGIGSDPLGFKSWLNKVSSQSPCKHREFPQFEVMGNNWLFNFLVKRGGAYGLVFEAQPAEDQVFFIYEKIGEVVELVSLTFEFSDGDEIRLHLKLKSMNSDKEWTVISRAFEADLSGSVELKDHSELNAVFADTPNSVQALSMMWEQDGEESRASFKIQWIEKVLTKIQPRFDHCLKSDPTKHFYRGPPIIFKSVLEKLERIQRQIQDRPEVKRPAKNAAKNV